MKIFCDYCGNQFDTDKNAVCPSCGAIYDGDAEIKEAILKKEQEEMYRRQREEFVMREQQARLQKNRETSRRIIGIGCLLPVILITLCFAVVFIAALVQVIDERNEEKEDSNSSLLEDYEYESPFEDYTETEEDEPSHVYAVFNEEAQTEDYYVICDDYEKIDRYPFTPTDGYMYVSFHLTVKNTGIGKVNTTSDVVCLADGVITSQTWDSDRKELPDTTLPAGVSAEGYMCYEVPVDAEEFQLIYGDIIYITIPNTLTEE